MFSLFKHEFFYFKKFYKFLVLNELKYNSFFFLKTRSLIWMSKKKKLIRLVGHDVKQIRINNVFHLPFFCNLYPVVFWFFMFSFSILHFSYFHLLDSNKWCATSLHFCKHEALLLGYSIWWNHLFFILLTKFNFFLFDYYLLLLLCLLLLLHWMYFFKYNTSLVNFKKIETDNLNFKHSIRTLNPHNYIRFSVCVLLILILFLFNFKSYSFLFFFNFFYLNNFSFNIIYLLLNFIFFLFILILNLNIRVLIIRLDYYFILNNLFIIISLLYLCNNLLSFFFILETISILILYKFVILKNISNYKNINNCLLINSNNGLNLLFFQYWINFFSTIIILYCMIMFLVYFGSLDFNFINNLFTEGYNKTSLVKLNFFIVLFFIALFFKLGITPFHFYKLDIYKGLPLISLFFYNIFFFISFLLFFIILFFYYFNNMYIIYINMLYVFIFFGFLFLISLMFNVLNLKSFLAYSTSINLLNFLFILFI